MAVKESFELVFELGSPVTLKFAMHLDGLLSHACFRHTGCTDRALDMVKELLLYNEEFGFYHGSAMAFGVTPEEGVVAKTRHYVGGLKFGKQLRDDIISPNTVTSKGVAKYRKLQTLGGPERTRLNKHDAYYSPFLIFHGVGDIEQIEKLVGFHISRLGANANSGSGTIKNMWMRRCKSDFSCIDAHNQIARNLPLSWLKKQSNTPDFTFGTELAVKAPYWKNHEKYQAVMAVPVEKIRRVIMTNN